MPSASRARGFTLIELMVVVILIGILAFMAMPTMNAAAIDRHVYEDAANIQDVIREAHSRALGRGGAVLVKLSTKDSNGSFQTYEIRSDIDGGQNLPLTGCKAPTSWVDDATLNMVQNAEMNFSYEQNNNIKATIYGPDGVAVEEAYLCFASAGRTFYSKTRIFDGETVMAGAIRVQVARYKSGSTETIGIVRNVLVPPSGAARVVAGGG